MPAVGDCYRRAYYFAVYGSVKGPGREPTDSDRILVHGIIEMPTSHPDAGKRLRHAWVEKGDIVFETGSLPDSLVIPYGRAEFDQFFKVDRSECATYTADDATFAMLRERHWGPWHY